MVRTDTTLEDERTTSGAADAGTDPRPSLVPNGATDVDASRVTVIRPASRIPRLDVGELWHYRELLWTLVWRDVSVRYKQTFLGVAWAILVPAFTALVYVIVFGKFANFPAGTTPYPSLVVAGVLPMQYFASALSLASLSLLSNLLLAAVNVRYRDVRYMIPVFLQVLPLLSGVMFAVDQIPVKWQWILSFNPMASVIAGWRWAVLDASQPNMGQVAIGVAVACVLFVIGLATFRKSEPNFADTI